MMIDFFGNENLPLPRMERPYGRGLRIVADATKVNEKKKEKEWEGWDWKALTVREWCAGMLCLIKKTYYFTVANKS